MIFYIFIFALIILIFLLFASENDKKKVDFEMKKNQLKKDISAQNNHLQNQKKKIELADDLKIFMKKNNDELFKKVATLNNSLFEEIHKKNKNN